MSVQQHCLSPLSEGMFASAVMSSGCGMTNMLMSTPEKVYPFWQEVMRRLGCSSLSEFRAVPAERLFAEWQKAKSEVKGGTMAAFPVLDGVFNVKDSVAKRIPYIVGSNSQDMAPPILYSLAKKWQKGEGEISYAYYFDRALPGDNNGAWHSADLWYWFGTLDNCWRPMEQKDYDLSDEMTTYLCNFAKNGDPNGENLPHWSTSFERKGVLCLGERRTAIASPSVLKMVGTMLTNKAVGE